MNEGEREGGTENRKHKRGLGSGKWQPSHNEIPSTATLSYLMFVRNHTWHAAFSLSPVLPGFYNRHLSLDVLFSLSFIILLVKQAQLSFSLHPGRARGQGDGEARAGWSLSPVFRGWQKEGTTRKKKKEYLSLPLCCRSFFNFPLRVKMFKSSDFEVFSHFVWIRLYISLHFMWCTNIKRFLKYGIVCF